MKKQGKTESLLSYLTRNPPKEYGSENPTIEQFHNFFKERWKQMKKGGDK
jgi:hypothetical protein